MRYRKISKAKQELIFDLLALGKSYTSIAKEVEIQDETVRRYYLDNKEAVDTRRQEIAAESQERLKGASELAISTLVTLLEKSSSEKIKADLLKFVLTRTDTKNAKDVLDVLREFVNDDSTAP